MPQSSISFETRNLLEEIQISRRVIAQLMLPQMEVNRDDVAGLMLLLINIQQGMPEYCKNNIALINDAWVSVNNLINPDSEFGVKERKSMNTLNTLVNDLAIKAMG